MKISSPTRNRRPPLLIRHLVVTVTVVLSHQLPLCLKTHHRLIRLRRNGGLQRVITCGFCWWRWWWWCSSFWLEGMVSFVLSHHYLARHPLPSSRRPPVLFLLVLGCSRQWDRPSS